MPNLPADHPYRSLLDQVLAGVGDSAASQAAAALPAAFAQHCAQALRGTPDAKLALYNELEQRARSQAGHAALFQAVRDAIFGGDPGGLTPALAGEDAALWAAIVAAWRNSPPDLSS